MVTNHHVAGHCVSVRCVLADRREVEAEVVGSDALCDIAVLRLKLPAGMSVPGVAAWGDSAALRVGAPVYAMGCPLALSQSVTAGIVSNTALTIPRFFGGADAFKLDGEPVGSLVTWIGHDAVIFPGNSGGPLIDASGRVVGINEIGIGLGGAIPAAVARPVAESLMREGRVRRAWTGMTLRHLYRSTPDDQRGALVEDVRAGSPAEAAGIRRGDRLVAVAGQPVSARHDAELSAITRLLVAQPIGSPCTLHLLRGGGEVTATITPLERDEARAEDLDVLELGAFVRRVSRDEAAEKGRPDTRGALVGGLRSGGPAAAAVPPLAAGDIILAVDGRPVSHADDLKARLAGRTGTAVLLTVARRGEQLACRVEAGPREPAQPPTGPHRARFPAAVQAVTPPLAQSLGLPPLRGVRITELLPGAPDGLRVGDVVVQVDGQPLDVRSAEDGSVFRELISAYEPGTEVTLTLRRADGPATLKAILPARPPGAEEAGSHRDHLLEFTARDCSEDDRRRLILPRDIAGALVADADAGGWAAVGGLRADDLIIEVDGTAIASLADLRKALAATGARRTTTMTVRRNATTSMLEIDHPLR